MCGIAGLVNWKKMGGEHIALVKGMCEAIQHRGPDDQGIWSDLDAGIVLGQRRLSIVDLSEHGHQPMVSVSGRYVLTYNGEIYNAEELRNLLKTNHNYFNWRGHSDTEILINLIEAVGLEQALKKLRGMFAFGVWDRSEKTFSIARDRMGEKPLYYGQIDGFLVFGSDLRAIEKKSRQMKINTEAMNSVLRYGYIAGDLTMYQGVKKLLPGTYLKLTKIEDQNSEPISYWTPTSDLNDDCWTDETEYTSKLEQLLRISVKNQMECDVPYGAFLSGGIDSSLVVSIAQQISVSPIQTFTIGFDRQEYDEAPYAKQIANYLGTSHSELYVTDKDAIDMVPQLMDIYDEPFADSSQIPTALVSKMTRQSVTVALSGDGGDEVFGGYSRYSDAIRVWNNRKLMPDSLRKLVANLIVSVPEDKIDSILQFLPFVDSAKLNGRRLHRLGRVLSEEHFIDMYSTLMTIWPQGHKGVISANLALLKNNEHHDKLLLMRLWDMFQYLPDDLMTKVDRASMHYGLEVRAPLLDVNIVNFALKLPANALIRDDKSKWILREILYKSIPKELIERKKMGFSVPLSSWLRGPLKSWASDLLSIEKFNKYEIPRFQETQMLWKEHQAGQVDRSAPLWNVLMLLSWFEKRQ